MAKLVELLQPFWCTFNLQASCTQEQLSFQFVHSPYLILVTKLPRLDWAILGLCKEYNFSSLHRIMPSEEASMNMWIQ